MTGNPISYLDVTPITGACVPIAVSQATPLPVALSGGIGGLSVAGTVADGAPALAQFPVTVAGVDQATGFVQTLSVDGTGALNVVLGGGGAITVAQPVAANLNATVTQGPGNVANPWATGGPAALGTLATGNPIRQGGVFNTTLPTVTTGQIIDLQLSARGVLYTTLANITGTVATISSPADNQGANNCLAVVANGMISNGTTNDRMIKPRTAFKLPNSLASNNAANIKATAGNVFSISGLVTLAASTCFLKLFDTTGVPNPGALAQLYLFPLTINDNVFSFNLPTFGLYFPTGIGIAIVANAADLDNTAIAAGQIQALNVSFQ